MSTEDDKILTAIHEAAHAVLCIVLKKKFSNVMVYARCYGGAVGRVSFGGLAHGIHTYLLLNSVRKTNQKKFIVREIMITISGYIAEQHMLSVSGNGIDTNDVILNFSLSSDCDDLMIIKNHTGLSDIELQSITVDTRELIESNFSAIAKVAKALLDKKRLGYFEVRNIVKRCNEKP